MIEYSRHAREQMAKRNYPDEWVEFCLQDPDIVRSDPKHPDRIQMFRCIPGRWQMLKVVVPKDDPEYIITVHFDREFPCQPE